MQFLGLICPNSKLKRWAESCWKLSTAPQNFVACGSLKHFSGLVFIFKIQYPTLFLEQVDFTCTFLFAYIFQDLLHLTEYDLLVLGVHNHLHRLHLLTSLRLLQERERRRGTLALQHAAGCLNTFYLTWSFPSSCWFWICVWFDSWCAQRLDRDRSISVM